MSASSGLRKHFEPFQSETLALDEPVLYREKSSSQRLYQPNKSGKHSKTLRKGKKSKRSKEVPQNPKFQLPPSEAAFLPAFPLRGDLEDSDFQDWAHPVTQIESPFKDFLLLNMAMFEKEEAFEFIRGFLGIDSPEQKMRSDKRGLLDQIIYRIHTRQPFQNIWLMSFPPSERRPTTPEEAKTNFTSGLGGMCFDLNIATFHLLTAIGFDVLMVHASVSSTIHFPNNHISLLINSVEKDGDQFFADVACGYPTFQAISMDFEKESPVFVDSFLEYKLVKHEGKLLRMHRKGDMLASRGRQENSVLEFWIDDWRRFYTADLEGTKEVSKFLEYNKIVFTDPSSSPFHRSHRVATFTGGKASIVLNDKTLIENEKGELVTTVLNGDEEILSAIKQICAVIPDELVKKSLANWRQISSTS